jgi:hypothetical protein
MTLLHRAAPDDPVFVQVLNRFYGGKTDEATDALLARPKPGSHAEVGKPRQPTS